MKYIKKPVVIEATQWFRDGDHSNVMHSYFQNPSIDESHICSHCNGNRRSHGWIETLEGGHIVCPGDYIITGIKGETYPCKPDIFAMTYEALTKEGERI